MDNVTHALFGLGIYGMWSITAQPADLHTSVAAGCLAASVLGSEAPDFDILVRVFAGSSAYLRQHRAISHSIVSWPIWGFLTAFAVNLFYPGHFWVYFLLSIIGVLLHVGLDVLTTYGTQALWPFYRKRLAYDALFIVDPVLILLGAVAIVLLANGWAMPRTMYLIVPLTVLYLCIRIFQSLLLRRFLRSHYPEGWSVSALPGPLPWWWSFVAQSAAELIAGRLRAHHIEPQVEWQTRSDNEASLYVWSHTRTGRIFKWFARHLVWTQSEYNGKLRITLADATYRYGKTLPFTAYVELEASGDKGWRTIAESVRGQKLDGEALVRDAINPNDRLTHEIQFPHPD